MIKTLIGTWHEIAARELRFCPSYYAADWQTIETTPGDSPAYLEWDVMGFTIPMPKLMRASIPARTLAGELYSGFGGVNYASTAIKAGPYTYGVTAYPYEIGKLVDAGTLTLNAGWEWLTLPDHGYINHAKEHYTKDMVCALAIA